MQTKTVPGFEKVTGRPPLLVWHTFEATADGQLSHLIDGTLRATIPPEGWEDYCAKYPEAQDIVNHLTKPTEIKAPAAPEEPAAPSVLEQLQNALADVQRLKEQLEAGNGQVAA